MLLCVQYQYKVTLGVYSFTSTSEMTFTGPPGRAVLAELIELYSINKVSLVFAPVVTSGHLGLALTVNCPQERRV